MNKRVVVPAILIFSWLLFGIWSQSILATRPPDSRDVLFALIGSVTCLYIGLDAVIAPETSFLYIVYKHKPLFATPRPTLIRAMGLIFIFVGVAFSRSVLS